MRTSYACARRRHTQTQEDPLAALGTSVVSDWEKLSKWVADSKLDPNDPNNAAIVYLTNVSTCPLPVSPRIRMHACLPDPR